MDDKNQSPKLKYFTLHKITLGLGLGTFSGWGLLDPEAFKGFLTAAWREEVIKMMIAFTLAGFVHRFIFRKDIEKQLLKIVTPIVDALNKIADRSEQTASEMAGINTKVADHGERIMLIEQHLTERKI